ncbi:MAG: thioesterase family protein [Ideonella sp.]
MTLQRDPLPPAAYAPLGGHRYQASGLTRGPWNPDHQHAGPPIALVCRVIEQAATRDGLTHLSRLTANLLRPVPIGELEVDVTADYIGRNAGHFSASLRSGDKEIGRFTALLQRETPFELPEALPGHPLPTLTPSAADSAVATFPFAGRAIGYADLVETRSARGKLFSGPCAIWFRMRHPLVEDEATSPYQRVVVAADSGNGISAILDIQTYLFVNSDLTIHLLRRPVGEWIGLDARTHLGESGIGLAESALFDAQGLIGRSMQSLSIRKR